MAIYGCMDFKHSERDKFVSNMLKWLIIDAHYGRKDDGQNDKKDS